MTDNWARGVLKSMDWVKRKGITGKVKTLCPILIAEEKLTFQRAISTVVYNHDITALSSTLIRHLFDTYPLESRHSTLKVLKTFPYKGVDDKRQITATFVISATG